MEIHKKAEQMIERGEHYMNSELRPDSGFCNLFPTDTTKSGANVVSDSQNRQMQERRERVYNDLSSVYGKYVPYSILGCILTLPPRLSDWKRFDAASNVLIHLLSERGWMFFDALPTAKGQPSMSGYLAMTDPRKSNSARSTELWLEYRAIAEVCSGFQRRYQGLGIIKQLEDIADPMTPGFFRRCIIDLVGDHGDIPQLAKCGDAAELLGIYCQKWKLSQEQLDMSVSDRYSLRAVLTELLRICIDVSKNIAGDVQILDTPFKLSKDAYGRYCESIKAYKELKRKFESESLLICSSSFLSKYISQALTDAYQHVDTIKCADDSAVDSDHRVRLNGRRAADSTNALPQFLYFSWLPPEKTRKPCDTLIAQMCSVFCEYQKHLGKDISISADSLAQRMSNILALSLAEIFAVHEERGSPESTADALLTLAPVIVYSIFKRCQNLANPESSFTKINVEFLLPAEKVKELPNHEISSDIWLFSNLCCIYKSYYGRRCTKSIQEEWDAAFLVYSGYLELYKNSRSLFEVERSLKETGNLHFPGSPYFKHIAACLKANQVSLAHERFSRVKERMDRFHPEGPGDPGWSAVSALRLRLEENGRKSDEPWLEQFERRYLLYGYTPVDLTCFLEDCFKDIILRADPPSSNLRPYQAFCEEHKLLEAIDSPEWQNGEESIALAALEYTMRLMAEEQCSQRLYEWLTEFISCRLRKLNVDGCCVE